MRALGEEVDVSEPTVEEARRTAAEGWIWGFALLENYRTMYSQAVDADDRRYVGGFGCFRHYSQPFTPANTDVVTPNNDTPYSWAWLDLRTEPYVISVPAVDRYYVLPLHDLDTSYLGYIGARTTGSQAGDYLVAGPGWDGVVPEDLAGVLRADTFLVGVLGRTSLAGPATAPPDWSTTTTAASPSTYANTARLTRNRRRTGCPRPTGPSPSPSACTAPRPRSSTAPGPCPP